MLFPIDANNPGSWASRLRAAYSDPVRHYHNLSHVLALLDLLDSHRNKIDDPISLELAIWFHDVVYDPRASDNEERSIELFHEYAEDSDLPTQQVDSISALIRATIMHLLPANVSSIVTPSENDLRYFLDFDLAVLSWSDVDYRQYARNVRKEYAHVPDPDYRSGRMAILHKFLNRDQIYFHPEFANLVGEDGCSREQRARDNIQAECVRLEVGDF